jgi:SNF2 family DNA or RNA helicase
MTRVFAPREYQAPVIDWVVDLPRNGLWVPMGGGKTVSTLTAIDHLSLVEDVFPVLVIAPLRVASSTWPDEVTKWAHLHAMRVVPIVGTAADRRRALRKPAEVHTINYENLPWLIEALDGEWPYRMVVADESTKLKSFRLRQGSVRAQALARVAHKTPRFVELTGTPSPNGLQDLWGQMWFLDKGERLGRSFQAFINRWFQTVQVGADRHAVQIKPLPFAQVQIEDRLRDLCLSINVADYLDIREPIVNTIRVELPAKARQMYRDMEREMFLALDTGHEVEAFNAASKTIKCLQLANGAIYNDDTATTFSEIHDAKLQALDSIIAEAAGAPVMVAYHFKSDLARLQRAFPQGRALDADPRTITEWNAGRIPVLFAHPASAGHGLNLQDGGNILAFFGHNWNLEEYQQIIERIGPTRQAQAGHDRPVFIHHIVATGTVDELVMARRESKREIQDLLMEAMRKTK